MTALPGPGDFDAVAAEAMVYAASLTLPGQALDTRTVLLALTYVHVRGRWDRIWLHCARSPDDIARLRDLHDPSAEPRELWDGTAITRTCADALRTAARIASSHHLPIAPGVLFIALITDPAAAAAKAVGVGSTIEHGNLMRLAASELLGIDNLLDPAPNQSPAPPPALTATSSTAIPEVRTLQVPTSVHDIWFSPDGHLLAGAARMTLRVWEPAAGTQERTLDSVGCGSFRVRGQAPSVYWPCAVPG